MSQFAFGTITSTRTWVEDLTMRIEIATTNSNKFDQCLVLDFANAELLEAFLSIGGFETVDTEELKGQLNDIKDRVEELETATKDGADVLQSVYNSGETTSFGVTLIDDYNFDRIQETADELENI